MKIRRYGYVYLALGVVGLGAGLLWWNFYGCTDSCPINSSPSLMALRGSLIGLCAAAILHPRKPKPTAQPEESQA